MSGKCCHISWRCSKDNCQDCRMPMQGLQKGSGKDPLEILSSKGVNICERKTNSKTLRKKYVFFNDATSKNWHHQKKNGTAGSICDPSFCSLWPVATTKIQENRIGDGGNATGPWNQIPVRPTRFLDNSTGHHVTGNTKSTGNHQKDPTHLGRNGHSSHGGCSMDFHFFDCSISLSQNCGESRHRTFKIGKHKTRVPLLANLPHTLPFASGALSVGLQPLHSLSWPNALHHRSSPEISKMFFRTWDIWWVFRYSMTRIISGFPRKMFSWFLWGEFHWINRTLFTLVSESLKISETWALHSRAGIFPRLVWRSGLSLAIHPFIQLGSYSTCTWGCGCPTASATCSHDSPNLDAKLLAWSNSAWTWCYLAQHTPPAERWLPLTLEFGLADGFVFPR